MPIQNVGTLLENIVLLEAASLLADETNGSTWPLEVANAVAMPLFSERRNPLVRHTSVAVLPCRLRKDRWLLAKMGKRVLRPGGLKLTQRLLTDLAIGANDSVVEFAPGLGVTARLTLDRNPKSYTAIERDHDAAAEVNRYLSGPNQRCVLGTAEETGLADASANVVYGEAMRSIFAATAPALSIR